MSSVLTSMMQANILVALMEVKSPCRKCGLFLPWLRRTPVRGQCIAIREHSVLRLEEWAEMFAGCDDIEPGNKVVVGKSNDALCCGECLTEDGALSKGILGVAFEEHEEEIGRAYGHRGQGMPGGGGC